MENQIYVSCKDNKGYSPVGVRNLMKQAEKDNNGDLQAVLDNKHKYKELIELYHANFLALALYKSFGEEYKFSMCIPEDIFPDVFFIKTDDKKFFPLEIMELYKYNGSFKNYKKLAEHIWDKKGLIKDEKCYLLLASRMTVRSFNVSQLIRELKNYKWYFYRIYLSFYTKKNQQWTFFEIFPATGSSMYFSLKEDEKFWY